MEDGASLFARYQEAALRVLPLESCIREAAAQQGTTPPSDLLARYLQLEPSVIDRELNLCGQQATAYVAFREQDSQALIDMARCIVNGLSSNAPLGCGSLPDTLLASCTRNFMNAWSDAQRLRPSCSEPAQAR